MWVTLLNLMSLSKPILVPSLLTQLETLPLLVSYFLCFDCAIVLLYLNYIFVVLYVYIQRFVSAAVVLKTSCPFPLDFL